MYRIIIITSFVLLVCTGSKLSLADDSLIMSANGNQISAEIESAFLGGAATALSYANVNLLIDQKVPIYCAPKEYALSGKEIRALANESLKGEHKPELFIVAAIDALKKKFPCK